MAVSIRHTIGFFLWSFLTIQSSKALGSEVVLVADPWCPFTCEAGSAKQGLMIDLVEAALGPKYQVKYLNMAWARAVEDTRKGGHSAIVGALKSDAPDFVFPKTELAQQNSCFYVRGDSKWEFKGEASLKGLVLGAVKDYAYGDQIDSYIEKAAGKSDVVDLITGTDTGVRLFMKLKAKRLDVLIEDETVAKFILKDKPNLASENFKQAGCLGKSPLYAAFSPAKPDSKNIVKALDEGLKALKANKKYDEILAKYGLK